MCDRKINIKLTQPEIVGLAYAVRDLTKLMIGTEVSPVEARCYAGCYWLICVLLGRLEYDYVRGHPKLMEFFDDTMCLKSSERGELVFTDDVPF